MKDLVRIAIQQELQERQDHQKMILSFIAQYCCQEAGAHLSREEWQDFCFRKLFQRTCHTNTPFSTFLNRLMPSLGFPLGYAHNKVSVYRGLRWITPKQKPTK